MLFVIAFKNDSYDCFLTWRVCWQGEFVTAFQNHRKMIHVTANNTTVKAVIINNFTLTMNEICHLKGIASSDEPTENHYLTL